MAIDLFKKSCTYGNITGTANYSIIGINPERQEIAVHGTAQTLVEAGLLGKNFRQNSVKDVRNSKLLDCVALVFKRFDNLVSAAIHILFHNFLQFSIIHLIDSGKTLGQ